MTLIDVDSIVERNGCAGLAVRMSHGEPGELKGTIPSRNGKFLTRKSHQGSRASAEKRRAHSAAG